MSGPFTEGGPVGRVAARSRYPLDNDDPLAITHHACLSLLFDAFSAQRVHDLLGPGGLRGRRCLEVGAGVGGSFAVWLADQVGTGGYVLATDLKPRGMPEHPQLTVLSHDLCSGEPLGVDWDFIHARLTLGHLPQRREILTRLIGALRPGGHILIEDWDAARTDMVLAAPTLEAAELYTLFQETVGVKVFTAAGTDRTWARRIHPAMLDDGLVDVHTVMHAQAWTGGGPGCHLVAVTIDQLRPSLLAAGLADERLDRVQELLADPGLVLAGHPLYSTSGRRPGG